MRYSCSQSELVVEQMIETLRAMPSDDIERYPNKYCEVIDNFGEIIFEPGFYDGSEYESLSNELIDVAKSILKTKDELFVQAIYEDYRANHQSLFDYLYNREKDDYDEISEQEKLDYALCAVMSSFEYEDSFDFDEELHEGYKYLAIEGYDRLGSLINTYLESDEVSKQSELPIAALVQQLSISCLKLSEYYLTGDAENQRSEVKKLVRELQKKILILSKRLGVYLEDSLTK